MLDEAYRMITGTVEVSYNGEWGTVCDNGWDHNDAHVACRSLGYIAALQYKSNAYYGQGSGNVWLEYLSCTGAESSIADCTNTHAWGNNLCSHNEDAGVICATGTMRFTQHKYFVLQQKTTIQYTTILMNNIITIGSCVGDVCISGGSYAGSGTVFIRGKHICTTGWDTNDANVVCKMLGYTAGAYSTSGGR